MLEVLILGTIAVAIAKGISNKQPLPRAITLSDFRFDYQKVYTLRRPHGEWRAYIEHSPGYGNRSTSLHDTHRLRDTSNGKCYVCWTEPLETFEDCQAVSRVWAQNTKNYIEHGIRF